MDKIIVIGGKGTAVIIFSQSYYKKEKCGKI